MRYTLDGMLPEQAFKKSLFKNAPATLEGGGGQSAPAQAQPTSTQVTNTNIPDYARPYVETMLGATQQQLFNMDGSGNITGIKPYTPYSTNPSDYIAPFSPMQQQSQSAAANLQTPGQFGQATQAATQGVGQALGAGQDYAQQATDPNAVGAYMNPYIQNALAPALALQNQQFGQQQAEEQGRATQAGAFGGGREAVMSGLNQQNQMLAQNQLVGNAYNAAYGQAQQAQQYGAGLGLQGSQAGIQGAGQLAGIGGQQLGAQQNIINTQSQLGAQQQQEQQNIINQGIQNYATAQQYPQQQLAFMNAQLRGLPLQTSTVQGYQAAPNPITQFGGLGATALGAYGAAGGFKAAGGVIKEKKMASGGIASGVPAGKLPSMLEKLSDQQLAQKANLQTNDPETAADAISQQAFRNSARQGVASAAGGGFVNMAGGGIVAFAGGGTKDDAVAKMGKYETPDRDTLSKFYSQYGQETTTPVDQNDLATRSAEYKSLLGDRSDVGAKYIEALKNAQPDKNEQLWGRLMQFGAGMAAGTSPNALTNIGTAAEKTVPGLLEDTKERKKAQGELAKAQYEVSNMEYGDQVKLLTLAQTDRNAFAKIAADKGMKADELANALQMNINTNKTHIQTSQIAANATLGAATIGLEKTNAKDKNGIEIEFKSLVAQGWDPNSPLTMAQAQRGYFQSKSYSGQVAEAGVIEKALATDKELGGLNNQLTIETLKKNPDKDKVKDITDQIRTREATVREKAAVQSNVVKPPPNNSTTVTPTVMPKPNEEVYKGVSRPSGMKDKDWVGYKSYLDSLK